MTENDMISSMFNQASFGVAGFKMDMYTVMFSMVGIILIVMGFSIVTELVLRSRHLASEEAEAALDPDGYDSGYASYRDKRWTAEERSRKYEDQRDFVGPHPGGKNPFFR